MRMKPRCRCGNLVPLDELKHGLCRACVREKAEKLAAQAEADDRAARIANYMNWASFH